VRAALVLVTALVLAAAPALAATPRPDAHDRALVARLSARISTLKAVAKQTDSKQLDDTLKGCPALKGDPSKAFAAVFVLLPALLIDVVNQYKPQLSRLRDELSGMRPHSQLFADWLAREGDSLDLILTFDNHGKKIDYCRVVTVMLDKKATPRQVRDVLGVDPALLPSLTKGRAATVSRDLQRLRPKMQAFLVAAGLAPAEAKALTA
jgi:hypothetical protein